MSRSAPAPAAPPDRALRMRRTATALLVAMAALFLLARTFQHSHPLWPWLLAFAEAGMVGGMAD